MLAEFGIVLPRGIKQIAQRVPALLEQAHDQLPGSLPALELGLAPTASALVASVADARQFENARQMAAWLGLVPAQHSSGGKTQLLGVSKRGDPYLRTLLVHGARAVIRQATAPSRAGGDDWLQRLLARRNKNVATVALANRNARIVWALLARDRWYEPRYGAAAHAPGVTTATTV